MFSSKENINIKKEIAFKGLSLREFSSKIGISHSYLSQIINKKKRFSPTIAKKIADGLGMDLEKIFNYNG